MQSPGPSQVSQPLGTDGNLREMVHAILYHQGPRGCLPQGWMGLKLARQQLVKQDKIHSPVLQQWPYSRDPLVHGRHPGTSDTH